MDEITLKVERDEKNGWLVACWNDPVGKGGITTQGKNLRELQDMVKEAVQCPFGEKDLPKIIRIKEGSHKLNSAYE